MEHAKEKKLLVTHHVYNQPDEISSSPMFQTYNNKSSSSSDLLFLVSSSSSSSSSLQVSCLLSRRTIYSLYGLLEYVYIFGIRMYNWGESDVKGS